MLKKDKNVTFKMTSLYGYMGIGSVSTSTGDGFKRVSLTLGQKKISSSDIYKRTPGKTVDIAIRTFSANMKMLAD